MNSFRFGFICFAAIFSVLSFTTQAATNSDSAEYTVASQELDLFDEDRQRPIKVTIWYPKGENCAEEAICIDENSHIRQPLIFSHGAMGAARGYSWIGSNLAKKGYVTLGVNHYGESWIYGREHINPHTVTQFWLRPQDISTVIDMLETNSVVFSQQLNYNNVTALGHSSGGATALALAGMQLDWGNALNYCNETEHRADRSCGYSAGLHNQQNQDFPAAQNWRDKRVNKVVLFDPALGHMANEDSLKKMESEVLLFGSTKNDFLIYQNHGGYYATNISDVTHVELDNGEGHFVYLDSCSHSHKAMGVPLCEDREGIQRHNVQQEMLLELLSFLAAPSSE